MWHAIFQWNAAFLLVNPPCFQEQGVISHMTASLQNELHCWNSCSYLCTLHLLEHLNSVITGQYSAELLSAICLGAIHCIEAILL